ncbi:MAG: DUF1549 domain-containing protein [Acidobacteria bacterium]|nr:DUF1549 domain-containing protein [Acidobacteriota bacterium]MBI3426620.1 DUF1549 domain-containing protein [Acidobacteriota bacterium]
MPMTGGKETTGQTHQTAWLKRWVMLACLMIGSLAVLDHLGGSLTSYAQKRPVRSVAAQNNAASDCVYLKDPEAIRGAQLRHRREVSRATESFAGQLPNQVTRLVGANEIPRKNFIDNILFNRMQNDNIQSAPLCSDSEFLRRVTLDLTGRIPAPEAVTAFLADENPDKRDLLVDKLLASSEFTDKWTNFYGDLFKNTAFSANINRFRGGRDAFYKYIKDSVAMNKSWRDMAIEIVTANGDSFANGATNFLIGGFVPMGPAQDVYDGMAVEVSRTFLGLTSMDCLLCHDGAGHLDAVNLWGAHTTRFDAWGLAAFFTGYNRSTTTVFTNVQKYGITETVNRAYQLNTTTGNRSNRQPTNGKNVVDPAYMFNGGGNVKTTENRREAFARYLVADPQFARAQVNYLWEALMVEALVSPSNTFDLARLSPEQQLPDGWSLQPANPELLQALAEEFAFNNFDIRHIIGLIAKSNAYQLSSQYPGEWRVDYVPYYARKYVRRLGAEELHDAIMVATGVPTIFADPDNGNKNRVGYRMVDDNNPQKTTFWVEWAMQLPEPAEPRNSGNNAFLNSFLRGDRDQKLRTDEPSILQALNMMNNGFVMGRIHQGNTAVVTYPDTRTYNSTVRTLLAKVNLSNDELVNTLYLTTLSRKPSAEEMAKITPYFSRMTKQQVAEHLQWVLLNKMDFLFNY